MLFWVDFSSVNIRVGTPPQWVSVFPSTTGEETWVIGSDGCDDSFACLNKRGGLFLVNESSSWQDVGDYDIGFDPQFGDAGSGYYGLDNIALDQYSTYPDQIVAVINTTKCWLGTIGLGIEPSNFTDSSQLTFLSTLATNRSVIPSFSYGYTAGAYYRLKGVPASLTLGGIDQTRFTPNNVTFQLSPDKRPMVSLNSISVSANPGSSVNPAPSFSSPTTLLQSTSDGLFSIDSSTPFLWLPKTACNSFSQMLNLTYNNTLQVYTYSSTSVRTQLLNWNVTFKFTVTDLPDSQISTDIYIPLSAFDQTLTIPFPNYKSQDTGDAFFYFALRQAANATQYTLGRSFLQEAYLAVDYERGNFSVSQAKFAADALTNTNIIAINPPENSNLTSSPGTQSFLSTRVKVGIGVGAGVALPVTIIAIAICVWRRRRPPALEPSLPEKPENRISEPWGDRILPVEAPADASVAELLASLPDPIELQG
ncbi:hypothetical protein Egran_06405 [Elaphomyces granulatus]|uniref:Peptidase A1 domain-containing protein n=1 Tax=Elaphomyces granulatus TaxID=519963 RepID=A0A232LPT6_9EURO|nr:hypothetical protein Egran_06405 [Elaphomyces granulatus]